MRETLSKQIEAVSEVVHELLDGEDGLGQLNDTSTETTLRVAIPDAFLVLALYLSELQLHPGQAVVGWQAKLERLQAGGDHERKQAVGLLLSRLVNEMHEDLHELATGGHPLAYAPGESPPEFDVEDHV